MGPREWDRILPQVGDFVVAKLAPVPVYGKLLRQTEAPKLPFLGIPASLRHLGHFARSRKKRGEILSQVPFEKLDFQISPVIIVRSS
jgi:hypothetical protein